MKYKLLIITNIPAFYKINLFNEINKFIAIKVIFISKNSILRNDDFVSENMNFPYEFITDKAFENRNKMHTLIKILGIILQTKYERILFSGWEILELIPIMFLNSKAKNSMIIESSILETKTTGIIWFLKEKIINRMSLAYPSGFLQNDILKLAKYKGRTVITGGVGLPRRIDPKAIIEKESEHNDFSYLYVGRISPEKNIKKLIDEFIKHKRNLSIIGTGPDLESMKAYSATSSNIKFLGYINNEKLPKIYLDHDIFILPSLSEPWGLVIEEALQYGLPCMVSSNVGCLEDLIKVENTGTIFEPMADYLKAFLDIEKNFELYKNNALKIDFGSRDKKQVQAYINE